MNLPYAEDVNYWKTGKSSPDAWIDRAKIQLAKVGGIVKAEGYGSEPQTGRAAYMLGFEIDGEQYKMIWPVLPSKTGDEKSARRQAATMLYHAVKQRCVDSMVLGGRAAFFSFLCLPDGRTAVEVATPELEEAFPLLLKARR